MKSDLRHSIQDDEILAGLSAARQIGIHVVVTAYCVGVVDQMLIKMQPVSSSSSTNADLPNISRCLTFFKENAALTDVLLNREPIYIAAQILGVDEEVVDKSATHTWPLYQDMQSAISALSEDNHALYEALGDHVIGAAQTKGVLRYELLLDDTLLGE